MHRYKQNFYFNVICICSLVFGLLAASQTYAAGQNPSQATPSYHCGPANKDLYGVPKGGRICSCKPEVPGDCKQMGKNSCEGGVYECPVGSDNCGCKEKSTRPVKDFKIGAFGSGKKVIVVPPSSSRSPKDRFKNKVLIARPLNPKIVKDSANKRRFVSRLKMSTASRMKKQTTGPSSVAISVDDCTFYGGTVQRDTSCSSKQSCLIGNANGCVTKAVK